LRRNGVRSQSAASNEEEIGMNESDESLVTDRDDDEVETDDELDDEAADRDRTKEPPAADV
jgi:hypothetical protein